MHNSTAPQTSFFTATLHMFLLQFNTRRIFDRQVCYSCKLTHTYRSFRHFQHSLFLGCWYLGDLFSTFEVLNSQLPLHRINIETIFPPSWSFPRSRSCVMWKKDLLEQFGSPQIASPPLSLEENLKIQFATTDGAPGWNQLVQRSSGGETDSRENKILWVHDCWDPFFPLCTPQNNARSGGTRKENTPWSFWRASVSIPALNTISASGFYTPSLFLNLCSHLAPWCLSVPVAATSSPDAHSPWDTPRGCSSSSPRAAWREDSWAAFHHSVGSTYIPLCVDWRFWVGVWS